MKNMFLNKQTPSMENWDWENSYILTPNQHENRLLYLDKAPMNMTWITVNNSDNNLELQ